MCKSVCIFYMLVLLWQHGPSSLKNTLPAVRTTHPVVSHFLDLSRTGLVCMSAICLYGSTRLKVLPQVVRSLGCVNFCRSLPLRLGRTASNICSLSQTPPCFCVLSYIRMGIVE
ncbi:hypothetical protein DFH29DRAFT_957496 [Suillus ampliporus]|nr:hypothetical protein DFH29DRAFT_957496 [Suillus ampliporus]